MSQIQYGAAAAPEEPEVLKSIAISSFDSENPFVRAYTAPRLLRDLLSGQVLDEACSRSNVNNAHELFVVSRVAPGDGTTYLSCVCASCRKHFHVTHRSPPGADWDQAHKSGMHMFILFDRKNRNELRATQPKYAFIHNQVRLACAADGCSCSVDIAALSPVLSNSDIDSFMDVGRPRRHLANAKIQDPGRFSETPDTYGDDTIRIFSQYLRDGLSAPADASPKKIKKRNKKFTVCFGDDFDPLLRSLGFVEHSELGEDGELEAAWHMPILEPESARTRIGTLRAKWENTEAELKTLNRVGFPERGWDHLRVLLGVSYAAVNVQSIQEANPEPFDLLGCLVDYKASVYTWAATLLAEKCPKRRAALYAAAKEIVSNRGWDSEYEEALIALMQHESSFDTVPVFQDESSGPSNGPMQPQQAAKHLGIEFNYPIDLIRDIVNNKAQEPQTDRAKAAEALDVIAAWKRANVSGEEGEKMAAELDAMAEIFKTARPSSSIPDLIMDEEAPVSANIPPGLRNIGNTCYLNSLLQYFYNVRPIRALVTDHTRPRLELDADALKTRRTGGNGTTVDLDEAIVARQFSESLEKLFVDLQTTTQASAQPSQKLANTALKSARALLAQTPESKPPPLPARPSPAPPTVQKEDADMVNVTVEPVNDAQEAGSSISSQTLVNDGDAMLLDSYVEVAAPGQELETEKRGRSPAEDVVEIEHVEKPEEKSLSQNMSFDERYKEITERLEHSDRKGTDQQDVGEIIENIMEHLMRSIPSDGPMAGRPDLQSDTITQTFFPMLVNYTIGLEGEGRSESKKEEVLPDRWLSAFPHPKDGTKSTIYEALDRSNDLQQVDTNLMRYTAIRSLPPILHICIQRSGAVKNRNPVIVENELFMDRYMDTAEIQQLRMQAWAWKHHLSALEESTENETVAKLPPSIMQQTKEALQAGANVSQFGPSWDSHTGNISAGHTNGAQGGQATEPFDGALCDWTFLDQPKIAGEPLVTRQYENAETVSGTEQPLGDQASADLTATATQTPESMTSSAVDIGSLLRDDVADAHAADDTQRQAIKTIVDDQFSGLKKERYLLHAVICHGGNVRAGHYWVWIRDFKRNVWLKYNDSTVTEESGDSQSVLDKLNEGGDPYYLAYVLEDKKDELVEVPPRAVPDPEAPAAQGHDVVEVQTIEGVDPNSDEMPSMMPKKLSEASQGDAMSVDEPPPYQLL